MEFYLNHGYNNLKEFEEKIFTPGIDMYLNATSFQARHHWHPHNNLQVLSGIQASAQSNNNGIKAEERLIDDSDQYDVGLYSSLSYDFGGLKFNTVIRLDQRAVRSSNFNNDYPNINASIGIRKEWKAQTRQDLAFHISSGTRAPHLSELLSNGIHHGAVRYELGDRSLGSERFVQLDLNYELSNEHLSILIKSIYDYSQQLYSARRT